MNAANATLLAATLLLSGGVAAAPQRVTVGPGTVRPIYQPSPEEKEVRVEAFELDRLPVTNAQFLAFVQQHPKWRRGVVKPLYADHAYLSHWASPTRLGPRVPGDSPVTRVSWFAARAYCKAQGARLPTEMEWELAAAASETKKDASNDPEFKARILQWYSRPSPQVPPAVGQQRPNAWGVEDLHGLIWEWVDDFGNTLVTGDSRDAGDPDKVQFCGTGALGAGDTSDYAAFMRIAFRSSLKGHYAIGNLGFRCARSLDGGTR